MQQEPRLRDIDNLMLPRKGFPQCDCNPDKTRVELERCLNKEEYHWKEIQALACR